MADALEDVMQRMRAVAGGAVAEEEDRVDAELAWPEASMRALQDEGLMGLVVPVRDGGSGLGLEAVAKTTELLGYRSGSVGLCFGMHCVGTAVIASKATADHRDRFLRPIAAGEHITTLAVSEPGTGSHFYLPEAHLEPTEDGYVLNGTKTFVTNGGRADSYVVSVQSGEEGPGSFSCVLLPRDAPGLRWGHAWHGWGMRGNSSISMDLEDVVVPRRDRLGEEGDQIWYVFHVVAPYFLTAMAGTYLGIAQRALDVVRNHLVDRQYSHTGRSLAQQQVLQHRFGTLWSDVAMARQMVHWAARSGETGGIETLPAIMSAKAAVSDCAVATVNEAMTLMGGQAYRDEGIMTRLLRDARAAHVMAPTTDMLRTWTGRALLGQPVLGD